MQRKDNIVQCQISIWPSDLSYKITKIQNDQVKHSFYIPHLNVFYFDGLLMNSLPALLSSGGLLDIHIVAIDRSAAIKHRWFPQDHNGGVTNFQHMKTDRSAFKDKWDSLKNAGIVLDSETHFKNWLK